LNSVRHEPYDKLRAGYGPQSGSRRAGDVFDFARYARYSLS